ncbi:MAG: glycosyltransferase family 87 protein, partial [Vitreimonas sp.]
VQVGLLIAGVSGLALYWLDKRPLAAGALVGVLAIKPHLALLWPVMLALTGRWRAFAAAAASTIVFVSIAGLAFGFDAYSRFLENLAQSQALISEQRITTPAYASLYASVLGFGAPHWVAIVLHGLSAVTALALFVGTLRVIPGLAKREPGIQGQRARPMISWIPDRAARVRNDSVDGHSAEWATQGAAMCAATMLMSPYLFFYDFTLLAVGAALFGAPRDRFELAAVVLAWSAGLSIALGYLAPLPLCPLAAWLVLIAALRRRGSAAPRPDPAQRK